MATALAPARIPLPFVTVLDFIGSRTPFSLFDDGAMFVARDLHRGPGRPGRYVIAIRGTNPVSFFDWIFGDFHVGRQLKWPYGDPRSNGDARISHSTALGLNILQHLRAGPQSDTEKVEGDLLRGVRGLARRLFGQADAFSGGLGRELGNKLQGLGERLRGAPGLPLDERIDLLAAAWRPEGPGRLLGRLEEAAAGACGGRFDLLEILEGGVKLRSLFDHGEDLLSFLARIVEQADGGLEIVVTGHSKGGALSTTAALWLVDTQGAGEWVPKDERWDPQRKAGISCYSFAGPTAGNAAFAAHSDAVIGDRCHRVYNTLDVVPHDWQVDDPKCVPGIYSPPIDPPPGMNRLAELVVRETRELGYTQIGNHVRRLNPRQNPDKKLYPDQLVYQHLQAYINELGLSDYMSQKTFFKI